MMARRLLTAAAAAMLALGTGCSKDDAEVMAPEAPTYLAPTSPENVLFNFTLAYNNRDLDAYVDALDPQFLFIPSMDDEMDEFDYDADLQSTGGMFDNVEAITLRLTHDASVESDRAEFPAEDGYRKIDVSHVDLRVETEDFTQGDRLILEVRGDVATFIFAPDPTQDPPTYRIVLQQDDG